MATLKTKYTVNPAYQAAFDALQQKTIDFVRTNDSINISIIQTIQRLQHLMLIVKLRSKTEPEAERPDTSANNNGDALITITAKSSIVQDIERMIEIYNQHFCTLETVNSKATKNLVKLAMQDISDNKDIEWYREFLRFKKIEAADFSGLAVSGG